MERDAWFELMAPISERLEKTVKLGRFSQSWRPQPRAKSQLSQHTRPCLLVGTDETHSANRRQYVLIPYRSSSQQLLMHSTFYRPLIQPSTTWIDSFIFNKYPSYLHDTDMWRMYIEWIVNTENGTSTVLEQYSSANPFKEPYWAEDHFIITEWWSGTRRPWHIWCIFQIAQWYGFYMECQTWKQILMKAISKSPEYLLHSI